jgi:predicted DNA-binding transcriptional regulator AlpA
MKNVYTIDDVMKLLEITSRSTFWRKRKAGDIPEPDLKTGHPRWFRATLERHLPNLNTNP